MTAIEFWQEASIELKQTLITLSGELDNDLEQNFIDLPFWHLPCTLKATIYDSNAFKTGRLVLEPSICTRCTAVHSTVFNCGY